jgi:peptidoglycan hydrolase-like protein with peptidoglycan-binding domain
MTGPSAHGDADASRPGSVVASWIFGSVLLALLIVIVFVLPEPSPFQVKLIRVLVAFAAALLSYFFVGNVVLRGNLFGLSIGSGGGFAIFILLVSVVNPLALQQEVADVAPAIMPFNPQIAQAQEALRALGLYRGTRTGVPDSATRSAIASFQSQHHLRADGYLDPATTRKLVDYSGSHGDTGPAQYSGSGQSAHSTARDTQSPGAGVGSADTPAPAPSPASAPQPPMAAPTAEANVEPANADAAAVANCQPNAAETDLGKESAALRKRTSPPTGADVDQGVNIQDLTALGDDRSQWSEQNGAVLQAYVAGVRDVAVDPEYCLTHNPALLDTELELTAKPGESTYVIGDITPQMRKKAARHGANWSTATLRQALLGKFVTVSGWLLYDSHHLQPAANADDAGTWRAMAWEIAPVTSIELQKSPALPDAPVLTVH